MSPTKDTRFDLIEDAVTLLKLLPAPDKIRWPVDEPGDIEVIDEAMKWLNAWLPKTDAAWKRHKRELRRTRGR